MKFQIPSMHHSEVNRRTDRQTDRQAESNMPFQLFQSWGHNDYTFATFNSIVETQTVIIKKVQIC